jgi:hypothetical protein
MYAPICDGRIVLNVEGKRYTASFRFERGVVTVTSGSASQSVEVGDVEDPKSVARTVLRTMVAEGYAALAPAQANASGQAESTERIVDRAHFFVRPRSSMRHSRTHH